MSLKVKILKVFLRTRPVGHWHKKDWKKTPPTFVPFKIKPNYWHVSEQKNSKFFLSFILLKINTSNVLDLFHQDFSNEKTPSNKALSFPRNLGKKTRKVLVPFSLSWENDRLCKLHKIDEQIGEQIGKQMLTTLKIYQKIVLEFWRGFS